MSLLMGAAPCGGSVVGVGQPTSQPWDPPVPWFLRLCDEGKNSAHLQVAWALPGEACGTEGCSPGEGPGQEDLRLPFQAWCSSGAVSAAPPLPPVEGGPLLLCYLQFNFQVETRLFAWLCQSFPGPFVTTCARCLGLSMNSDSALQLT